MGVFQVEHLEDRVGSFAVLPLDDGVLDAHLLGGHVVLKHSLAVQTDPRIGGTGNGNFDVGVLLHILVDFLLVVGAEPQLSVHLTGKHERAALGLTVTAYGGEILYGIFLQKFYDFVHDEYPLISDIAFMDCNFHLAGL